MATELSPLLLDATAIPRFGESLSQEYLEEHRLLPLAQRAGELLVATAGTPDPQALAELALLFHTRIAPVEVPEEQLVPLIREIYGRSADTAADLIAGLERAEGAEGAEERLPHDLEELANQAPVIRLVNLLLTEAVAAGASDVHLEAEARGLRVRYRIDGVLQPAPSPPAHLTAAVVSRLKVMAELDIAERRVPQDGRVRLRLGEQELDVRVSTLPTLHGESVVLRLLAARGQHIAVEGLGLAEDTLAALLRFARRPQGVLLATGPTGSGKTTTLYSLLERMRTGREKIVSVEDPVEYELSGVAQVPVQTRAGLTFARALRAILRQDPDILLVGEMRDPETAEICVQAALTGHLVLSTLHTNDAPSALTRLVDLGVAEYLVASTIQAVLAQRLVRRVCPGCRAWVEPDPATREEMGAAGMEPGAVPEARGCADCRGTGYRGRTGVYELLLVDDDLRVELLRRRGSAQLRQLALEKGMRPLRRDGWRQVMDGVTTPAEVLRTT